MRGHALTRGSPDTSLSGLLEFCADSVLACSSRDADLKLCVPVGLGCASALLSLLSCSLLVCQRCRRRRENLGEFFTFPYSLLGNLCGTVGAALSTQLPIQVLLSAAAAALDAVHLISWGFHLLLCWNSKTERRLRVMRSRRRQHILAVCALMVVTGGFLQPRVAQLPAERPLSGRRLMHVTLQDNTEILGYILGLLSLVIACTCRFPAIRSAHRGQMLTQVHLCSGLLSSLAGALYAAAILLSDIQFGFLLRAMPWLLSATCCATLDLLILVIHLCRRDKSQQLTSLSPVPESLLGFLHTENKAAKKTQRKEQLNSSAQSKAQNVQKMAEMGHYMDVSVQPARKICLTEVMPGEEMEEQLLSGKARAIRHDRFCSSDTSFDSSLSSDLEWDFEEENSQWRKPTAKQQLSQLGCPGVPKLCSYAMSGFLQKALSGSEECESISSTSLKK